MLIIVLNGSPRANGNTAHLLRLVLDEVHALGATGVFIQAAELLAELGHPFCRHCSSPCAGVCYRDTRLDNVFRLFREADGLVLGTPVYFGTVSAQLKALWDKTRALRKEKALLNVVGAGVVCGTSRFGGQETALRTLHAMMLSQGMTVVGDGHRSDDPGHHGCCAQQPAGEDPEAVTRARVLARRVVEVAEATRPLRRRVPS
ncbi:MAG: flavodoxin family protein [Desulfotomaculales bacterium]